MKKFITLGFIILLTACGVDNNQAEELQYNIIEFKESSKQNTLKVSVPEGYGKNELIDISTELHKGFENKKCVTFFYTNKTGKGTAYATSAYLPKCKECATDKDSEGNLIQFKLIRKEQGNSENPLEELSYEGDGKVVVEFINDMSGCKCFIVELDKNEATLHKKWINGDTSTKKLMIQNRSGNKLYYNSKDDENFVEGDDDFYWKIEANGEEITLNNENGIFESFKILSVNN